MSEGLQVWLAISFKDTARGQKGALLSENSYTPALHTLPPPPPFFLLDALVHPESFRAGGNSGSRERWQHAAVPHGAESDALVIHY